MDIRWERSKHQIKNHCTYVYAMLHFRFKCTFSLRKHLIESRSRWEKRSNRLKWTCYLDGALRFWRLNCGCRGGSFNLLFGSLYWRQQDIRCGFRARTRICDIDEHCCTLMLSMPYGECQTWFRFDRHLSGLPSSASNIRLGFDGPASFHCGGWGQQSILGAFSIKTFISMQTNKNNKKSYPSQFE